MKEKVKNFFSRKINFSFEHESPKDFVVSQWQNHNKSSIYLCYRWLVALFYVFSFLFSLSTAIFRGEAHVYFIYLTNWNLLATMILCSLSAVIVSMHHVNYMRIPEKMTLPLKLYWFLSICCTMYSILISTIYWTVLYHQDNNQLDLNNVIVHMTNSLVLIIDIFVIKHGAKISHFVWPLLCGFAYLGLLTWLYPFLGGVNR